MTHPRGFGSQARSPCFLRQSLDTRWDSPGTGRTCYTRLWRPRGGVGGQVGQGEGHMSSGDGNRSRARQASHQVMGGRGRAGGGGTTQAGGGGSYWCTPPLSPPWASGMYTNRPPVVAPWNRSAIPSHNDLLQQASSRFPECPAPSECCN